MEVKLEVVNHEGCYIFIDAKKSWSIETVAQKVEAVVECKNFALCYFGTAKPIWDQLLVECLPNTKISFVNKPRPSKVHQVPFLMEMQQL